MQGLSPGGAALPTPGPTAHAPHCTAPRSRGCLALGPGRGWKLGDLRQVTQAPEPWFPHTKGAVFVSTRVPEGQSRLGLRAPRQGSAHTGDVVIVLLTSIC